MSDILREIGELDALFTDEQSGAAIVASGTFDSEFAGIDFDAIDGEGDAPKQRRAKRGEKLKYATNAIKCRARRDRRKAEQTADIAVLDFETDPFDAQLRERIIPFVCELYSDQFEPIVIWDEDEKSFLDRVIHAIENLPRSFTIYAHNGGKFDYLFFLHRLRGRVHFKGGSLMRAEIGSHELRDSFHLISEKLAQYKKDEIDYSKMRKQVRDANRDEILRYLHSDCVYLFDLVSTFVKKYGFKISIGQAAMMILKRSYKWERVSRMTDEWLRQYFFGGRVECLQGRGRYAGGYKLFDVNALYPFVMANFSHPVGREYRTRRGVPNDRTCFLDLSCRSEGAFPVRQPGAGTEFPHRYGRFKITIHEYKTALKHKLISRVNIHACIDNDNLTTFEKFVVPMYEERLRLKPHLKQLEKIGMKDSREYGDAKKDDTFQKLLMNNAWGKFAQNPRNFHEYMLTDPGEAPEDERETWGQFPDSENADFAIWKRPLQQLRFNNVGTGASITGAARAVLLDAICNSTDAVYCDTDSLICYSLENVTIDPSALGAWDCETELDEIIVTGKKQYAYRGGSVEAMRKRATKRDARPGITAQSAEDHFKEGAPVFRNKGAPVKAWRDFEELLKGGEIVVAAWAPTLTKTGRQVYIDRRIRATAGARR